VPSRFGGDVALHLQGNSASLVRRSQIDHERKEEEMAGQPMPASGAWRAGDPVGHRQFLDFTRPIALDGGVTLDEVTVAYET